MRIQKIINFPVRKGSPLRVIKRFSLNHKFSAALGAFTLTIILIQVVSSIIEVVRRKGLSGEAEMMDTVLRAMQAGNLNKAQNIVNRAQVLYPASHGILYLRGVVCLRKKLYSAAKDSFQKAVMLDSAIGDYHLGLSVALFHLGKLNDSLASLKMAEGLMDKDSFKAQLEESGLTELKGLLNDEIINEQVFAN